MLALIMLKSTTILGPRAQRPVAGGVENFVCKPVPVGQPRDNACDEQTERDETESFHRVSMRLRGMPRQARNPRPQPQFGRCVRCWRSTLLAVNSPSSRTTTSSAISFRHKSVGAYKWAAHPSVLTQSHAPR